MKALYLCISRDQRARMMDDGVTLVVCLAVWCVCVGGTGDGGTGGGILAHDENV